MSVGASPAEAGRAGRVVLVTGGNRGIGLACARRFVEAGDRVAVTYRSKPPPPEGAEPERELVPVRCDVTSPEDVEAAFGEIESRLGPVEVLVANAGLTRDGLLLRMDDDAFTEVVDTNLAGAYRVAKRAAGPMLRARRGRLVFMSSVAGLSGSAGQANYAASKGGLVGLARSLARELASRGITVNVVAPGPVDTDMTAVLSETRQAEMTAAIPLARFGTTEEVAAAVVFLSSPEAAYITGAVLPVDGGLGMGH